MNAYFVCIRKIGPEHTSNNSNLILTTTDKYTSEWYDTVQNGSFLGVWENVDSATEISMVSGLKFLTRLAIMFFYPNETCNIFF